MSNQDRPGPFSTGSHLTGQPRTPTEALVNSQVRKTNSVYKRGSVLNKGITKPVKNFLKRGIVWNKIKAGSLKSGDILIYYDRKTDKDHKFSVNEIGQVLWNGTHNSITSALKFNGFISSIPPGGFESSITLERTGQLLKNL